MQNYCVVDFETRSKTPINKGLGRYFSDPSFEVLCGAFKFKGKKSVCYSKTQTEKMCAMLLNFMKRHPIISYNSAFEAGVISRVLDMPVREIFPYLLPLELVVKYLGGPDRLFETPDFFDIDCQKDPVGKYLINVLCIPFSDKTPDKQKWANNVNEDGFVESPYLFKQMMRYCQKDVVLSSAIWDKVSKYVPEMRSKGLFEDNILNFERNLRGIRYNKKRVLALKNITADIKKSLHIRAKQITRDHRFNINSAPQVLDYLQKYRKRPRSTQEHVLRPLAYNSESKDFKELIYLRLNRSPGIFNVLDKVLENCDKDGVVYNSFRLWGAGQSGRFTSYGSNPLTWPRTQGDLRENIERLKEPEKRNKDLAESFKSAKGMMRSCIIPHKNCVFYGGDFSQIEFKLLMLASGELKTLKRTFEGYDAYKDIASKVYCKDAKYVTDEERYVAKRVTLALGYGVGPLKAKEILWSDGIFVDIHIVRRIFNAYMDLFPKVSQFGYELERKFNGKYLTVPFSGRKIHLFNCSRMVGKYGLLWTYKSRVGSNVYLPRHKMVSWTIQSLACDLFRFTLRNLYLKLGLVTDIPFHDEVVCSVPLSEGKPTIGFKEFERVLSTSPDFLKKHLPYIPVNTWKGGYYGK